MDRVIMSISDEVSCLWCSVKFFDCFWCWIGGFCPASLKGFCCDLLFDRWLTCKDSNEMFLGCRAARDSILTLNLDRCSVRIFAVGCVAGSPDGGRVSHGGGGGGARSFLRWWLQLLIIWGGGGGSVSWTVRRSVGALTTNCICCVKSGDERISSGWGCPSPAPLTVWITDLSQPSTKLSTP